MRKAVATVLLLIAIACDSPTAAQGPTEIAYELIGGGKILFRGPNGWFLIDSDARTIVEVGGDGFLGAATVSPDGSRLTFLDHGPDPASSSCVDGTCYDVWVSDISGAARRVVATLSGNRERGPTWTPDGTGILFTVPSERRIMRYHATTPGIGETVVSFPTGPGGSLGCPSAGSGWSERVSMAPSGDVVFSCGNEAVYVFSASDSSVRRVTQEAVWLVTPLYHAPVWSPDGARIAFIEESIATPSQGIAVNVMDVASRTVQTAATLPTNLTWNVIRGIGGPPSLCWSAGGTHLIFAAHDQRDKMHLYSVPASGGTPRRITNGSAFEINVSCTR